MEFKSHTHVRFVPLYVFGFIRPTWQDNQPNKKPDNQPTLFLLSPIPPPPFPLLPFPGSDVRAGPDPSGAVRPEHAHAAQDHAHVGEVPEDHVLRASRYCCGWARGSASSPTFISLIESEKGETDNVSSDISPLPWTPDGLTASCRRYQRKCQFSSKKKRQNKTKQKNNNAKLLVLNNEPIIAPSPPPLFPQQLCHSRKEQSGLRN